MEFLEYLILILIVIGSLVGVSVLLVSRFGVMKPKGDMQIQFENLKLVHQEEKKVIEDTLNIKIANLINQNKSLDTLKRKSDERLNKIKMKEDEVELENEGSVERLKQEYEINPIKAVEYVKKLGFNPDALNNPALAPLVWEKLNDNKDLALVMGIIVPKGTDVTKLSADIVSTPEKIEIDPVDQLFSQLKEKGQVG